MKRTVQDLDLQGKRIFLRVDFNVPQREDGSIEDDSRIRASIPTIRHVLEHGGTPVLASHLGRPKGKPDPRYSLKPVASRLSELLGKHVTLLPDCIGAEVGRAVEGSAPGEVILLENLRFHGEEERNDAAFAAQLAGLGQLYVNDAFGAAHRAHASVAAIARHFPSAAAGLLMQKEIEAFGKILSDPPRPFTAILGGAKVSDKIGVLQNLIPRCDVVLVGGGMAFTFLKAEGIGIGKSLVEEDKLPLAKALLAQARERFVELRLPVDHLVADRFAPDAARRTVEGAVPEGWMALDIGPRTALEFAFWIRKSRAVVWNGPMGVFEMEPFRRGTEGVARAVAEFGGLSVVGGGDSVAALEALGLAKRVTHVSTGGGASLEMLEGKELPGIAALSDRG